MALALTAHGSSRVSLGAQGLPSPWLCWIPYCSLIAQPHWSSWCCSPDIRVIWAQQPRGRAGCSYAACPTTRTPSKKTSACATEETSGKLKYQSTPAFNFWVRTTSYLLRVPRLPTACTRGSASLLPGLPAAQHMLVGDQQLAGRLHVKTGGDAEHKSTDLSKQGMQQKEGEALFLHTDT